MANKDNLATLYKRSGGSGNEICSCVRKQGAIIEPGDRHTIVRKPDGKYVCPVPTGHAKELHTGIWKAIIKTLMAAGFIGLFLVYGLPLILQVVSFFS